MPVYEYHCLECGNVFTITVLLSEREGMDVVCPGCDSKRVKQLISPFSIKTSVKS